MWTGFKRIVRSGFVGFWRNAFVSLASIFVMTVALLVIGATMLSDQLLGVTLKNIQDKVDINLYFVTTASQEDIDALVARLEAMDEVTEVRYTSRDEALTQFRERHKNDELTIQALEELGDNPLGASLAIKAADTTQYENIATFIEEQRALEEPQAPLIDEVNYFKNKGSIDKLTGIIGAAQKASVITLAVLMIAAVLITFNTIRLAIYTTREEISVMRLVGASNTFIRGPFMLQGLMYGLIAGVVAILILYPVVLWIGPASESFFQFNLFEYFVNDFVHIFSVLVGSGMALGLISSVLAVSRYLRV
ncbi:ABC transporter permease [Candidatus Kaiserbacteria bacterium]|nr:ABC transporter permease [Candidatus Kaiserbacteria bacterium]MCB9811338.1 ABC transporter permease [Candidatus Nomurabacteria bacterium]